MTVTARHRAHLVRLLVMWMAGSALALPLAVAADSKPFLFVKTGEQFATQDVAGPTVTGLTAYLGDKMAGATNLFAPFVMNNPVKAAEWCGAHKPAMGIVTPGFYFTYAKTLGMDPVLEVHRAKVKSERYILVGKKDASENLGDWAGKTIATALAAEQRYLLSVILQGKLGDEVRLKMTTDIEGAAFDLVEGKKAAADLVLMEEGTWNVFKEDPELGGKLKTIYRSDDLPPELVVQFRPAAEGLDIDKIKTVLKGMDEADDGKKILESIRVDSIEDVNQARLDLAKKLFHGESSPTKPGN